MTATISPRISIITATFNAAEQLPYTLRSLREQTFREFEWIVVDGNSTDGTQALLRENGDLVSHWISEPDRGIYDAFNKGCALARGEWLIFLGAGDELAAPGTLSECTKHLDSASTETNVIYGRQTLLSPVVRAAIESSGVPWDEIKNKWENGRLAMPPHAATFSRKTLFTGPRPFDLRFPIASDAHFYYRTTFQRAPIFIPVEVSRAPVGGVSIRLDTMRQQAREIEAINRDLGIEPPLTAKISARLHLAVAFVLSLLPRKIAHCIADLLRRLIGKPALWSVR